MTNALVNRIKQRLEAQRDFMRVVFSNHHALVWHLTDAPSLRALGIKPKQFDPNRSRAVQAPREVTRKPRVPRAIDIPDLETALFEEAGTDSETSQNPVEPQTEIASPESQTEIAVFETTPELEMTQISSDEEIVSQPAPLEPGRAQEIPERPA